jgi:hypothetical protein
VLVDGTCVSGWRLGARGVARGRASREATQRVPTGNELPVVGGMQEDGVEIIQELQALSEKGREGGVQGPFQLS